MSSVMELAMKDMGYLIEAAQAQMKYLPGPVTNVMGYGAKGDGVTDDTAAIQEANDAAATANGRLHFPPGIYKVTALSLSAPMITGDGWNATEIKGSTASDNVITISAGFVYLSGMKVSSSVAAASRTGAGIKVTGGALCLVSRVRSIGHKYGIWNQGQGNEFDHCFCEQNSSHGVFVDGSVLPQNEIGIYFCQSNSNGGDGFHLSGPGLGVRMTNVTGASNLGWGINNINALNDIWITQPEISGNGGGIQTIGCSDIQITAPFVEASHENANVIIQSAMTTLTGGFIQAADHPTIGGGVLINATDVTIVGTVISSNNTYGIRLGGSSTRVTLAGVIISNTGATGVTHDQALLIDPGASPFTAAACDFASIAPVLTGNVPSGSVIAACRGLATYVNQTWQTSGDTAINGYFQFVDDSGTVRKVATIA